MVIRLIASALLAVLAYFVFRRKLEAFSAANLSGKWPWLLAAVFFLLYAALKINRHTALLTYAFDLSAFDYAYHNTLHGDFLYVPFFGQGYLREHFFPAMLLFLPIYALWQSPVNLLLMQALIVSLAAVPMFRVVKHLTGKDGLALTLTIAFLMNPFIIRGIEYDFHVEMLAPLAVSWAVLGFLQKRAGLFYTFFILFLMTKEHEWLTGLFLASGLWIQNRKHPFVLPMAGLSLLAGALILFVVNPLYARGFEGYLARYHSLGNSPLEIVLGLLRHPEVFFRHNTLTQSAKLLVPLLGLPMLSPLALGAVPAFAIHMTGWSLHQLQLDFYQGATIVTLLFIAAADGIRRLAVRRRTFPACAVLLPILVLNAGYLRFQRVPAGAREAVVLARTVPEGGSVAAENEIIPHLSKQKTIVLPEAVQSGPASFDFVLVKTQDRPGLVRLLDSCGDFEFAGKAGGYTLFRQAALRP